MDEWTYKLEDSLMMIEGELVLAHDSSTELMEIRCQKQCLGNLLAWRRLKVKLGLGLQEKAGSISNVSK